jgi:Xaa-Pro aminopeptidase
MHEKNVEALLISTTTNLFWLCGFTGSFGYAIVSQDSAVFVTDSRYVIQAQEQVSGFELTTFGSPVTGIEKLKAVFADLGLNSIAFESMYVSYGQYQTYLEKLKDFELQPMGDLIENLRMIKTASEVELIKNACALTDVAFDHIKRLIQPGVTEFEIQLELEFFLRRNNASCAFEPIIVSGANSARPHGHATEKPLEVGDLVTMDFGAQLAGYCADMTRTVVVGKASEKTRNLYNLVLRGQMEALAMMRPGVVVGDVDAKVREIFAEENMAQFFGHGLGHGLGILVHDTGRLGFGSTTVLEPGQIWTVEPGIYLEGFGGCRIEDDVLVTETGIEIFNKTTKELLELPMV